jgi:hypothetical protein
MNIPRSSAEKSADPFAEASCRDVWKREEVKGEATHSSSNQRDSYLPTGIHSIEDGSNAGKSGQGDRAPIDTLDQNSIGARPIDTADHGEFGPCKNELRKAGKGNQHHISRASE